MFTLLNVRHAMMNWNRFITASILVAAVSLKLGAPFLSVAMGLAAGAAVNWQLRPRR